MASWNHRANGHRRLRHFPEALADFDEAIRLRPGYASAYSNRGVVYNDMGNPRRAIEDYDKAIELDAACLEAYASRGAAKMGLNEPQEAATDFRTALEKAPPDWPNRAAVEALLKDLESRPPEEY